MKAMKIMKCAALAALRHETEHIIKPVDQLHDPSKAFRRTLFFMSFMPFMV